jgi:hypothetical protein
VREYTVDRAEGDVLVCFSDDEERLLLPFPAPRRPEGMRALVFDAIAALPYVYPQGRIVIKDGICALILPANEKSRSEIKERFGKIFKNRT